MSYVQITSDLKRSLMKNYIATTEGNKWQTFAQDIKNNLSRGKSQTEFGNEEIACRAALKNILLSMRIGWLMD